MHVKRCDNCGRDHLGPGDAGNWRNSHADTEIGVLGEPEELDFCSWRCEGFYAMKKAADIPPGTRLYSGEAVLMDGTRVEVVGLEVRDGR